MSRGLLICIVLAGSACSGIARDTATYERDTSALLDTRTQELQACYDAELARNPSMVGKLTVHFRVEKATGKVVALEWDRNRSSVSDTLATCVVSALRGLTLDEADRRDGIATYTYAFRVIGTAPPAAGESSPSPSPGP
jgi:hypothetical protein